MLMAMQPAVLGWLVPSRAMAVTDAGDRRRCRAHVCTEKRLLGGGSKNCMMSALRRILPGGQRPDLDIIIPQLKATAIGRRRRRPGSKHQQQRREEEAHMLSQMTRSGHGPYASTFFVSALFKNDLQRPVRPGSCVAK